MEGSTATYDASERANLGKQVAGLFQTALGAANIQGEDGHYLLAGAQATTQPFDATGAYQGDGTAQTVITGENSSTQVDVPAPR